MTGVTAIVLAGSRPGTDPFAQAHATDLKTLIPVAGKPMVCRPVEALLESSAIACVRVVGQQPDRIAAVLQADPRLKVEASQGTIAATLASICTDQGTQWPLLVTTADHALLDVAMIEDFCAASKGSDIALALVERDALMKLLPESKRTWIPVKDGAYSGANLFYLGGPQVLPAIGLWRGVEQDRKKGWKLLWQLGPAVFAGAMLRILNLEQVLSRIGARIGVTVRPVLMRDPLACVDVDKQADLDLVEKLLAERG